MIFMLIAAGVIVVALCLHYSTRGGTPDESEGEYRDFDFGNNTFGEDRCGGFGLFYHGGEDLTRGDDLCLGGSDYQAPYGD